MLGIALASLLATTAAAPADLAEPGVPQDANAIQAPSPDVSPFLRDPEGWRRELGLGFHTTNLWSKESSHYSFYSAGLAFRMSKGSWGPFLDVSLFLPLQARQDGRVYAAGRVYGDRIGGDLLIGWQRRWYPTPRTELEIGPGLHMTALWMPGATGYRDFSAFPLGVGVQSAMRWTTGIRMLGRNLRVGWYATATLDLLDPLRGNDLSYGIAFLGGALFGLDKG